MTHCTVYLGLSLHVCSVGGIVLFFVFFLFFFEHFLFKLKGMKHWLWFPCSFEFYPSPRCSFTNNWLSNKTSTNLQNRGRKPSISQRWPHACPDPCLACIVRDYGTCWHLSGPWLRKQKRNFELQGELVLKKATVYWCLYFFSLWDISVQFALHFNQVWLVALPKKLYFIIYS